MADRTCIYLDDDIVFPVIILVRCSGELRDILEYTILDSASLGTIVGVRCMERNGDGIISAIMLMGRVRRTINNGGE